VEPAKCQRPSTPRIIPHNPHPDDPVFHGGTARPNTRFQPLCKLAGIGPRKNVETGVEESWKLKDLRKTCATYYDEHLPESSIEIFGHSVGGITCRHYAHRAPLAFNLPGRSVSARGLIADEEGCNERRISL
jgi:pimeloyl-ACP methyl ester carboxylesterase